MKTSIAKAVVGLIVVLGCINQFRVVVQGDWSDEPSMARLREEAAKLRMPLGFQASEDTRAFSKITYRGLVREGFSDQSFDEVIKHFNRMADKNTWTRKTERRNLYRTVLIYCDGPFAHLVEIDQKENVRIYAGTYWSSSRSSEKYCR